MYDKHLQNLELIEAKRQLIDAVLQRIVDELGYEPMRQEGDTFILSADKRATDLIQDQIDEIVKLAKEYGYHTAMNLAQRAHLRIDELEQNNG